MIFHKRAHNHSLSPPTETSGSKSIVHTLSASFAESSGVGFAHRSPSLKKQKSVPIHNYALETINIETKFQKCQAPLPEVGVPRCSWLLMPAWGGAAGAAFTQFSDHMKGGLRKRSRQVFRFAPEQALPRAQQASLPSSTGVAVGAARCAPPGAEPTLLRVCC